MGVSQFKNIKLKKKKIFLVPEGTTEKLRQQIWSIKNKTNKYQVLCTE